MDNEPLALSMAQTFEIERMNRVIDSAADIAELRRVAKMLLQAWQSQKAATQWVMRQQLSDFSQLDKWPYNLPIPAPDEVE